MPIDILQSLEIIENLENYKERARPPVHIREELDLDYKIENQSVLIFEIRPARQDPKQAVEHNVAKATFIKSKNCWKVFWFRADMKWHGYKPSPTVKNMKEFIQLLEEDKHSCFWG